MLARPHEVLRLAAPGARVVLGSMVLDARAIHVEVRGRQHRAREPLSYLAASPLGISSGPAIERDLGAEQRDLELCRLASLRAMTLRV